MTSYQTQQYVTESGALSRIAVFGTNDKLPNTAIRDRAPDCGNAPNLCGSCPDLCSSYYVLCSSYYLLCSSNYLLCSSNNLWRNLWWHWCDHLRWLRWHWWLWWLSHHVSIRLE